VRDEWWTGEPTLAITLCSRGQTADNGHVRVHRVEVVRRLPHLGGGFTQGLIAEPGGVVLESTGQYGQSELRRYRLGSDSYQASAKLPDEYFGEGICQVGDSVWQLTWRERKALRWDAVSLKLADVISYNREGWGICVTESEVVTSDGTSELVRRDPETLEPRDIVRVRCEGKRVRGLNDLAWSGNLVWANVAPTTAIVGVDLATGEVTDLVDASAAAERRFGDLQAIMNGITAPPRAPRAATAQPGAATAQPGTATEPPGAATEFLLTGKEWRWIRQVRLAPPRGRLRAERLLAHAGRLF
jgi:glutaminyl-peptide cyclotransferase